MIELIQRTLILFKLLWPSDTVSYYLAAQSSKAKKKFKSKLYFYYAILGHGNHVAVIMNNVSVSKAVVFWASDR